MGLACGTFVVRAEANRCVRRGAGGCRRRRRLGLDERHHPRGDPRARPAPPRFKIECSLLTGPPNGSATEVASSSQTFSYHSATRSFSPSGFTGPVDEEDAEAVAKDQAPLEVYFSCKRLVNAVPRT
jgi:hypothetical protein